MMESIKKLRESTGAGMMDVKKALADAEGNEEKAVALLRERGIVKAGKKDDREAREGLVAFVISDDRTRAAMVEVNSETDFVARNADFQAMVRGLAQTLLENRSGDLESFKGSAMNASSVNEEVLAAAGRIGERLVLNRVAYLESAGVVAGYVHSNGKIGVLVELQSVQDAEAASIIAKDVALHVAAERPRYRHRDEVNADDIEKEREILTNKAINEGKPAQIVEKIVAGQIAKFYEENVLLEQRFVKDSDKRVQDTLGGHELASFVRFEVGA